MHNLYPTSVPESPNKEIQEQKKKRPINLLLTEKVINECNTNKMITKWDSTSQKSPVICLEIPCIDMRYSRMRHWSRVWNLPSRICITGKLTYMHATMAFRIELSKYIVRLTDLKETFKLNGDASWSLFRVEMHHGSFVLAASFSWNFYLIFIASKTLFMT